MSIDELSSCPLHSERPPPVPAVTITTVIGSDVKQVKVPANLAPPAHQAAPAEEMPDLVSNEPPSTGETAGTRNLQEIENQPKYLGVRAWSSMTGHTILNACLCL